MALVTRCPNCATIFRVNPLHLQVHGGDVRCGSCAQVFNGFATLATLQEPETADLPGAAVAPAPKSAPETPPAAVSDAAMSTSDRKAPDPVPDQEIISPAVPPAPPAEAVTWEVADTGPPAQEEPNLQAPETASTSQNYAENQFAGDHAAGDYAEDGYAAGNYASERYAAEEYGADNYAFDTPPPPKTFLGWAFGSLFLLVILAAQMIYFYRAELSVIAPGARPYLEQYCELLQCTVSSPQNAALLSIESSEMRADTPYSGAVTLTAAVRNHARHPQPFPSFELAFTDSQDKPLASHIFTPDAYLEANMDSSGTIAPDHKFNVKLRLDSGDLNAAGYRLLLFYPGSS